MSTLHRWIFSLVLASAAAARLAAFEPDGGELWPDGTITMHLQMGSSPTLSDGSTYNTSLDEALKQWNRNLGRVQFTSVIGSSVPIARGNGYNNVVLRNDVYGQAFGENVVAVTLWRTNNTSRTEADVIFNKDESWDSYRGSLVYPKYDIRRVALHEFGHVLGLTHPDEAGQSVTAIMNSHVSWVDRLQMDDTDGGAALYGPGIDNPIPLPVIYSHPSSRSAIEGEGAGFSVYASGRGLTYQWLKDGSAIIGATKEIYYIPVVHLSDAGAYSVVVSTPGGSVTSERAQLTVTPATKPYFHSDLVNLSVEVGVTYVFNPSVLGSQPRRYQWYKNDVPLEGETHEFLRIAPVAIESAAKYAVEVSNIAGSVRSNDAILTVLPRLLPPSLNLMRPYSAPMGQSYYLNYNDFSATSTYSYQWYKNGLPLAGATANGISIASLKPADAGNYFVVVRNSAGAMTSQSVYVSPEYTSNTTAGDWLSSQRLGDIVYFLYPNPARIERYHLSSGWLSPILLAGTPTAFAVDGTSLYVAFSTSVRRYQLNGTGETPLATLSGSVHTLLPWKDYVVAVQTGGTFETRLATLRRDNGVILATQSGISSYSTTEGWSMAGSRGRLISRPGGPGYRYIDLNADGSYGKLTTTSDESIWQNSGRTKFNTDESLIADDSGVYHVSDFSFAGFLGGPVTDLAPYKDGWILLRANTLLRIDSRYVETTRLPLEQTGRTIIIEGDDVVVFGPPTTNGGQTVVARHAINQFAGATAAPIQAPPREVFSADAIYLDAGGTVNVLSRAHRNIFRWSSSERRFIASIPLQGSPDFSSYSAELDRIYLGYFNQINYVDLTAATPSENLFVAAGGRLEGITAGGNQLFAQTSSGSKQFHGYNADGSLVAATERFYLPDRNYLTERGTWNQTTRRLFALEGGTLKSLNVASNGVFGTVKSNSSYTYGSAPLVYPTPNGSNLLLGSGVFVDATTFEQNNALPHPIDSAAWIGTALYTGYNLASGAEIQRWSATNYAETGILRLPGRVLRLFPWGSDKLVLVGLREGYLFFAVVGADLTIHSIDENKPQVRLANLASRAQVGTGHKILISGFVIGGTGKKNLLLRAVGPTLADYGVSGELANPRITLFNNQGSAMTSNDNWSDAPNFSDLVSRSKAIGAAGLRSASTDAALLVSLDPGLYTAHVTGVDNATGVGLVELFDADGRDSTARLLNISSRAQVGTGDGILIPGIVVDGDGPATVLIRAVGPGLVKQGVSDALANPQLQVLDRDAKVIASNDDWWSTSDVSNLEFISKQVGAAPLDSYSKDAAVVATLPPGIYTVHVKGVNDTTGVALVEVFYASP